MSPKQESEILLNLLLPFADKMLREHGEFYPFGGYMKPNGAIVEVGASDPDTDRPTSKHLIDILRSSFQELARRNECKAVALTFDVAVKLPNSDGKSDAIKCRWSTLKVIRLKYFSRTSLLKARSFTERICATREGRRFWPHLKGTLP